MTGKKTVSTFILAFLTASLVLAQTKPTPPKPVPAPKAPAPPQAEVSPFEKRTFAEGEIAEISSIAGGGNLRAIGIATKSIQMTVSKPKAGTRCQLQIFQTPESVLMVKSASASNERCIMDGEISVPADVSYKASAEEGNLNITGVKLVSEVSMGSGDILLDGIGSSAEVTIRRGSVVLDRATVGAKITVQDSANVRCNFSSTPATGILMIESRGGSVDINLPKATASSFGINFKIESGDFSIKRF